MLSPELVKEIDNNFKSLFFFLGKDDTDIINPLYLYCHVLSRSVSSCEELFLKQQVRRSVVINLGSILEFCLLKTAIKLRTNWTQNEKDVFEIAFTEDKWHPAQAIKFLSWETFTIPHVGDIWDIGIYGKYRKERSNGNIKLKDILSCYKEAWCLNIENFVSGLSLADANAQNALIMDRLDKLRHLRNSVHLNSDTDFTKFSSNTMRSMIVHFTSTIVLLWALHVKRGWR